MYSPKYPVWMKYYPFMKQLYNFDVDLKLAAITLPTFDDLVHYHWAACCSHEYNNEFYNDTTTYVWMDNFLHSFIKAIGRYEKYVDMTDFVKFLEFLYIELLPYVYEEENYEGHIPIECYKGHKYKTHIEFIMSPSYCLLIEIQKLALKKLYKKRLHESLNIIKYSPPGVVEFNEFKGFEGGCGYHDAKLDFTYNQLYLAF